MHILATPDDTFFCPAESHPLSYLRSALSHLSSATKKKTKNRASLNQFTHQPFASTRVSRWDRNSEGRSQVAICLLFPPWMVRVRCCFSKCCYVRTSLAGFPPSSTGFTPLLSLVPVISLQPHCESQKVLSLLLNLTSRLGELSSPLSRYKGEDHSTAIRRYARRMTI